MNGGKSILTLGLSMMFMVGNYLPVLAESKPVTSQEYVKNNKSNQNSLPAVGIIKDQDLQNLTPSGCFGAFQLVEDEEKDHKKYLFMVTTTARKSPVVMNLDGKYIIMKPISEKWGKQDTLINQTYSYKNVKIRADYSVYTSPKYLGKLEGSMYNVKLTLSKEGNKKVLRLRGYHGC
jgi:hypothetical protein